MNGLRTLPEPSPEWREWWDATRERRLLLQRCRGCSSYQHYPRALCTHCGGSELDWHDADGTGNIYSYTVVHRSPSPYAPEVPYVVALVRLSEGPVVLTNLSGDDLEDFECDQTVALTWEPLADGRFLPGFQRA